MFSRSPLFVQIYLRVVLRYLNIQLSAACSISFVKLGYDCVYILIPLYISVKYVN